MLAVNSSCIVCLFSSVYDSTAAELVVQVLGFKLELGLGLGLDSISISNFEFEF